MMRFVGKKLGIVLVLAVVFTMTVGGVYAAEMMTMDDGSMHNCPFMGVPALCEMSPLAHLSQWQQMFTTTIQQVVTLVFLMLLVLAIAWHFVRDLFVPKRSEVVPPRYRDTDNVFNPLKLAFARGVIHSKVF